MSDPSSFKTAVQKLTKVVTDMQRDVKKLTGKIDEMSKEMNFKLDALLDIAAPQRSQAFDGICVISAKDNGVRAPREATWTCWKLDDKNKSDFDFCLVSSAHVGLSHFCTTPDVAFVELPDFLSQVAEKVAIFVPRGLTNPKERSNIAANDVIVVKFKLCELDKKDLLPSDWPPSREYCPTAKFPPLDWETQRVVGKSNMELVSGSAATLSRKVGLYLFLLDTGEPGDSGTCMFSVCTRRGGASDASSVSPVGPEEPPFKPLLEYQPIGIFQGISSRYPGQRTRGKIAPFPSLDAESVVQLEPLSSLEHPKEILLFRRIFKRCTVEKVTPVNNFVYLKSDTHQERFGMLVSVKSQLWGWSGPMCGYSALVEDEDAHDTSDRSEPWSAWEEEDGKTATNYGRNVLRDSFGSPKSGNKRRRFHDVN